VSSTNLSVKPAGNIDHISKRRPAPPIPRRLLLPQHRRSSAVELLADFEVCFPSSSHDVSFEFTYKTGRLLSVRGFHANDDRGKVMVEGIDSQQVNGQALRSRECRAQHERTHRGREGPRNRRPQSAQNRRQPREIVSVRAASERTHTKRDAESRRTLEWLLSKFSMSVRRTL